MKKTSFTIVIIVIALFAFSACELPNSTTPPETPVSSSGVSKANTEVQTDPDGHTVEQNNIIHRLKVDNTPGTIKHLYVISAYSGQVLIYSTVQGKVTSGSKRLSPSIVAAGAVSRGGSYPDYYGCKVDIDGKEYRTSEMISDDGAYGSSGDYIFWFDSKGAYHQHYNSGGQIIHISDQPLSVPSIAINMELTNSTGTTGK